MERFAKRLRERARQLGLSDSEAARRAGLTERRFGHYVQGSREPDFQILLKICAALGVTPNDLLLDAQIPRSSKRAKWSTRLGTAAKTLSLADLELATLQIELLATLRARPNAASTEVDT